MSVGEEGIEKTTEAPWIPGLQPENIAGFCRRGLKITASGLLFLSFLYVFYSSLSHSRLYAGCLDFVASPGPEKGSVGGDIEPLNVSHIVFGIGSSVETWEKRRRYAELWWKPGETRGFVWLDKKPESWTDRGPPYRVSEDVSGRGFSGSASAVRMARIAAESFRLGLDNVRWFVMGDDDTVFLPENVALALAQLDHRGMWYVGAASESVEQNLVHSFGMAFGGGGFALSLGAASALSDAIDGCLSRYGSFYGSDQRVQACMSELGVPLTRHPGFHQMDVWGDAYGLLAAHPVAPLVSLHHLESVQPLIPYKTQLDSVASLMDAVRVDPLRTLQQAFCYDSARQWSVSVSWGYTAQIYPSPLAPYELEKPLRTFQTWRSYQDGPFTFNTRPMPADPCSQPAIFFVDRVDNASNVSGTVTTYRRYAPEPQKVCQKNGYPSLDVQRVKVFSVKMAASLWTKDVRRQCCDVKPGTWKGTIDVRLRRCGPRETVTPP